MPRLRQTTLRACFGPRAYKAWGAALKESEDDFSGYDAVIATYEKRLKRQRA
jgi:hypothetical protein